MDHKEIRILGHYKCSEVIIPPIDYSSLGIFLCDMKWTPSVFNLLLSLVSITASKSILSTRCIHGISANKLISALQDNIATLTLDDLII